jgi:heat shock protein HslJ
MRELPWLGAGLAALVLGCASAPPAPATVEKTVPGPQYLFGTEWALRDLAGTPLVENRTPTVAFLEPARISGNASCNRYSGPVELGDGTLKVGELASTRMACTPEVDIQERAFLVALQNGRRLEVVNGDLILHSESLEQPLRFRRLR